MLDLVGGTTAEARDAVEAKVRFAFGGGRTFIQHQRVPYPFHITRPHAREPGRPDIATLILQSASGGLYRGDRLALDISAGCRAMAHVTSQAATVVHATASHGIRLETRLDAGEGSFLALTTDPYILFPDTALSVQTEVTLGPHATVIMAEGFAIHDPTGRNRAFRRLITRTRIRRPDGTTLVDDAGAIDGLAFVSLDSPLGPYRAMGTVMILGRAAGRLGAAFVDHQLDRLGVLGGCTSLPNEAGLCIRLLALEGGRLARGLDLIGALGFEAGGAEAFYRLATRK